MSESFLREIRHLLETYAKSQRVVRLQRGSGYQLLRILRVGNFLFHAEVIDATSKEPKGFIHLPLIAAAEITCLDSDNAWAIVKRLYESDGIRVTP